MADKPENEDETLELTEELEVKPEDQADDEHQEDADETPTDEDGDEEETLVSFGDGDPDDDQPDDNATLREIRKRNRELNARIRELETSSKPKVEVKPEPSLESCDYDEERFKTEWRKWDSEQKEVQAEQAKAEEENRIVQQEWTADLQRFQEKKAALKMPDVEDCQGIVEEALNGVQQAVLVKAANDPALFMVALAKSPAKLAELAKMKDVIKLGAAIARMEGGIKVVTKRKAPNLDVPQRGSARIPGSDESSKTLAKLEKEAEESGDRSKLIAFKKNQAAKGK